MTEKKLKILVVRYRFIGDTVLTVPFLRNLRAAYPDAIIDMIVGPVSGEVIAECPYVDNFIIFDTTRKHKYENTDTERKTFFSYVKMIKKQNYDKAYVLKRSLSSALLVFLAGIKERIGFDTEHRGILLTKKVKYDEKVHEVESFLDVLKADNVAVKDSYLENHVSEKAKDKIEDILYSLKLEDNPKVLIHATSGNANKHWRSKDFAEVIEYLSNVRRCQIFYTGTKADYDIYSEIHSHINATLKVKPINLCGELSIQDSMALINKMNFVVGVDSGTLHIAASLNIPVIGIYGPMSPTKWKAYGDIHTSLYSDRECVPCGLRKKCPINNQCLKDITSDMVIQECKKALENKTRNGYE
ncbi:MAG: lipopolysaccharide heptosyltransferase II [bacterium]